MAKGTVAMAHKMTLMQAEMRTLQESNEALAKRRRAKRSHVQASGALTVQGAQDLWPRRLQVEGNRAKVGKW